MARVTVEDCVDKVENRFELILVASAPGSHDFGQLRPERSRPSALGVSAR